MRPQLIEATATDPGVRLAPVVIDGNTLFRVRGATAFPAEERADRIARRIEAAAADPALAPSDLRLVNTEFTTDILAGDQPLMSVMDADAALEHLNRQDLARVNASRIGAAISAYREDRDEKVLLKDLGLSLAAIALVTGGLFLLNGLIGRLQRRLEGLQRGHIHGLRVGSFEILEARRIEEWIRSVIRGLRLLVNLVVIYALVNYVLSRFPWTRGVGQALLGYLIDPLEVMVRAFVAYLPSLLFLVVLVIIVRWLLHFLGLFFAGLRRGTVTLAGFDPDWAQPTYKLVRVAIIAFSIVIAFPYLPASDSEAFKGVSILLGLVVSLGSTSAIANIVAGYTMTYRRAFRIGDRIAVEGITGDVIELRLLVTQLRTPKNEDVILPNSLILNSHVTNYSARARQQDLILHTKVGIGYETPWRQVEALLVGAAERTPGVLPQPRPFVLVPTLGDFAVTYEINAYTADAAAMPETYSRLHANILDAFNEAGIQIMTPSYVADPAEPKVVARKDWYAPPARPEGEGRGPNRV